MSLSASFGPGLAAELDYRRERIVEAAQGTRRVRRGRARRGSRATVAARASRTTSRVGTARPAH